MSLVNQLLIILALIVTSAFFSISEISLAASRKVKLRLMAEGGHPNAQRVLALQDSPGNFFTVVQIGLNAVAILGGIVGESALSPYLVTLLRPVYDGPWLESVCFVLAFVFVTSLFVLFADLMPKRFGMAHPERVAVATVRPMQFCMLLFAPLVWVFNGLADRLFRLLGIANVRSEEITPDDIMAMADAGAQAGVLLNQEQHLIANVFELDSRIIPSAMTARESIVFLTLGEAEENIRNKISETPHGKYPVCEKDGIDSVIGYVDAKDILPRIVNGQKLSLRTEPIVRQILVLPETLNLFEALERFRDAKEDFAIIVNEYALVVGLLTLQDVMSTVMGDLVSPFQEELIVRRDDNSWLIDGLTPIEDVMQALSIDVFEGFQNYETVAGFLMYTLRKVPKRTDFVEYAGYKFEVVDIDNYRIDQVLVTRAETPPAAVK
ncbi:MAG: hemolysin family protein [Rhodocyclaceae bacterium]|nr:hemolysin family protein [Rhodocyclaceae bacterium]